MRRSATVFALLLLPLLLVGGVGEPAMPNKAQAQPPRMGYTLPNTETNWHLTIETDAPFAFVGDLVALHIRYMNIGIPSTTVSISPTDRLEFDPDIQMPCAGCTELTLRALATGAVTIDAQTYGEVHYPACGCSNFILIDADRPVDLIVTIPIAHLFLAAVRHST